MALVPFDPEVDLLDPADKYPAYDSVPQVPLARIVDPPDPEQDWTEVHPNGSKEVTK